MSAGSETIESMTPSAVAARLGETRNVPSNLWQQRMDRLGQFAILPLLAVSTGLAALQAADGYGDRRRFELALVLVVVSALWSAPLTLRPTWGPRGDVIGFAVHTVLAATLVWLNPWFGIFAFFGYMLADRLPGPWFRLGFLATAFVMAGSQMGGYPSSFTWVLGYLLVVALNTVLALVFTEVTDEVLRQNEIRGAVIGELAEANRRLELALAENAGLHAQLVAQAREAGVRDERQRLAGELHDTLAQGLIGIITQLEAADRARQLSQDSGRHLDQARELARSNLTAARRSVRALRPEQLERSGLVDALEELARSWTASSRVPVRTEVTGRLQPTSLDVESTLFRAAQEALANVGRHADATHVGLTVTYLDDVLLLDVRDDGTGFDPATRSPGYGLTGMRERVGRVGGRLEVESAPGEGTAISVAVPLEPAPETPPEPVAEPMPGTRR
jgi:signal transduction histidine kinase